MKLVKAIFLVVGLMSLLLLASCGVLAQRPPEQAVKLAIMQQLMNVQQSIAEDLALPIAESEAVRPNFEVDKVTVQSRERVKVSELSGREFLARRYSRGNLTELYRVQGTFETTFVNSAALAAHQKGVFDVYLGTDMTSEQMKTEDVETWFLLEP